MSKNHFIIHKWVICWGFSSVMRAMTLPGNLPGHSECLLEGLMQSDMAWLQQDAVEIRKRKQTKPWKQQKPSKTKANAKIS